MDLSRREALIYCGASAASLALTTAGCSSASADEGILRTYQETDALGQAELVRKGEVSSAELVEAAVTVIERLNPQLNAVIHKLYDMGRAGTSNVDRSAKFAGVPFLLKELGASWNGSPNTSSSRYFKDVVATYDNEEVRRMKAAGLLLVGKTNAPENGWNISTEPALYGATHNPWDLSLSPGGSSGGSGAAVASGMVPIAHATDAGGSIRVPASCCGLVGLKPSRGRTSTAPFGDQLFGGVVSLCLSRTIRDSAAFLDAVAGNLAGDVYTPPSPAESWLRLSARAPQRLRIGYTLTAPPGVAIDPEIKTGVTNVLRTLQGAGHQIEEYNFDFDVLAGWQLYTSMGFVQTAFIYEAMEPFIGRKVTAADVEPATWSILNKGWNTSGVQHTSDVDALRVLGRRIAGGLAPFDVFVTPTLAQLPKPLGFYDMGDPSLDRFFRRLAEGAAFTYPFNVSGQPALSLPVAWSAGGLPIGVQFVGRYGDEATLLSLGTQLEQLLPWKGKRPPIAQAALNG